MLEPPAIATDTISDGLRDQFGLDVKEVIFLPLGVDYNAAVYRASTYDNHDYFLKLRTGNFNETAVLLTSFLGEQGVAAVIAPQRTQSGALWAELGDYTAVLYPFVSGRDGYDVALSDEHWLEFGRVLRRIHDMPLPAALADRLAVEAFSPEFRRKVRRLVTQEIEQTTSDPIVAEMSAFLREKRGEVLTLVERTETLAHALAGERRELVLCHSDLHAGNVLVADDGRFFIVDWDEPVLALRECDLMYPGGAQGFRGHTPQQEVALFREGYEAVGPVPIDASAIAYYRLERIIKDIAAYGDEIRHPDQSDEDRAQGLVYLQSNFRPGGTIDAACSD